MPNIGNHVDAIFLPESVNTSTTLRINGGDLHLDDNKKILLGQSDDLQIYHNGSHSYIDDAGTGNLYIRSGTLPIQNLAGTKTSATFNSGAGQELRFDNDIKFVTTSTGISVTGDVDLPDDGKLLLGADDDFQIYYDGGTAHIDNNQGQIRMRAASSFLFYYEGSGGTEDYAKFKQNAEVELYHDGILAFETTSTGIDVPLGTITGPATLNIDPAAVGDNTGTVVIKGDLQVDGTTTTINSTTLTVDDKNIVLASGAANAAAADGAGITIDGANQTFIYESANDSFKTSTRLGIRATPNITSNLRIGGSAGGEGNGTTYYSFLNNPVFQSDVTANAYYNFVQVKTGSNDGTAYTITNLEGYTATIGASGVSADSTITNLTGFNVKSSWTAGTNNYGFRGEIDTGTNRWNVYMDGSAPNYFAGNVGIGTNNPEGKLDVLFDTSQGNRHFFTKGTKGTRLQRKGDTSAWAMEYGFESNDGTDLGGFGGHGNNTGITKYYIGTGFQDTKFVVGSTGNVGIGTNNPTEILHIAGNNSSRTIKYGDNSAGYFISNTEVNRSGADQAIHTYHYRWNGTKVAQMNVLTGDDSTNKDNGYFTFETANAGTTRERLRIASNGNVGIGTDSPVSTLHLHKDSSDGFDALRFTNTDTGTTATDGFVIGLNDSEEGKIWHYDNESIQFGVDNELHGTLRQDGRWCLGLDQTSGSTTLNVFKASGSSAQFHADSNPGIEIKDNSDSSVVQIRHDSGQMVIDLDHTNQVTGERFVIKRDGTSANETELFRINSSGNVGIGTDNPTESLDVNGVAMASLLVDSVYARETWPAGDNTLAGNDLGTWTLTGGTLAADPSTLPGADYWLVDRANLAPGLNAITWVGNGATSYLTSPNINITNLRTNTGISGISGYSGNTDKTIADSRIYLTVLLAAQSMDNSSEYLEVELSNDGGTTWTPDIAFVSQDSDQDDLDITDTYWRKVVIDISEYSSNIFQIRFKGTGTGTIDGYGVSNLYIHEAPIPNRLQAKTLKLGDGKISGTYEHSDALTLVSNGGTSKLIVLEHGDSPRQNYIGINNSDNLEIAADEDNAGNDSKILFKIDGKQRMKLYTGTDAGASEAHLELIGHTTPTDRSRWRITAQDDGTHGYFTISDYSGNSWNTNFTVHEGGNVGIGTTDPEALLDINGGNLVVQDNVGNSITLRTSVGNGNDSTFVFQKSRGGLGTIADVQDGDDLGTISFSGYFDGAYNTESTIRAEAIIDPLNPVYSDRMLYDSNEHLFLTGSTTKMTITSGGNVGIGTANPTQKLHVVGNAYIGDGTDISPSSAGAGHLTINANGYTPYITANETAMFVGHNSNSRQLRFQTNESTRMYISATGSNVGIGTTHSDGYALSVRNITAPASTGGILINCDDWNTNNSEYGINIDIDSSNRTNLTGNRTHRGISADMHVRAAQNASNTSGTRQSVYAIYGSAYVDDTDNNDGKMYYVWGNYVRARVDGVNCANLRGAYFLAQCGDNATGQSRTVDKAYAIYANMVNDGNQTTITDAYGVYANVNQDDTGGAMTSATGVFSKLDRDSGTGGTGYLFRGDFDGTWSAKRGLWLTGDTESSMDGTLSISGSKTFRIPHPIPELSETKDLVHVCIEAPAHDLIYRGKSELVDGSATINLDTKFGMTEGTFVALNRNVQCFTSNESDWSAVRGSVSENILTIECQDSSSTATISWMVVGERQDDKVKASVTTDEDGNLILEPDKRPADPPTEKPEMPD